MDSLRDGNEVEAAVAALRVGLPVVLPTDTVYGICANAYNEESVRRAYELKGREPLQPSALLAGDVDMLLECLPELRGRVGQILRALLPGPFTLVVPNPARRYPWLTGERADTIGVRVPELPAPADAVVSRAGLVMATSANLPGGPDPARPEDVPDKILEGCGAVIDAGELPGVASTVIDLTGDEPRVLREGAVSEAEALERVTGLVAE
ncbi:MAG TPA: L-threonylcarbamoyladenylate synthase [Gaiellaceae bacterium]|nr:L-threonylcarbamoyladenylate synthase [Gaiellaceae bacterium]